MSKRSYILREQSLSVGGEVIMTPQQLLASIEYANAALKALSEQSKILDFSVFEIIGMRNLSGLVGEYFVSSVQKQSADSLQRNLHQDGYPDLLLTNTPERKKYFCSLYEEREGKKYPKGKQYFSPYREGGIEVKATCGSTPPASKLPKLLIGEQRIGSINSFDWKAHHQETNNLLGILWDFIDEVPVVVAVFYRDDLSVGDWGKIVRPKEGGGRTTSVSIMNRAGVQKMCAGWLAVIDDEAYKKKLFGKKWINQPQP